ncbi:MAG: hemerythrin domain-containing protein [Burkholderiaceae bacterium]|nr:hemerythrin domain-containing protein [Burkholderiaceae bacterium]
MSHTSFQVIRDEHQALAAMLSSITLLIAEHRRKGVPPPFDVLRAMLFYIDEYPERLHHRKESELLFPAIRRNSPEAADVLDKLDRDHANGERAIRDLEHALIAYEMMGEPRAQAFSAAMDRYLEFYRAHMRLEEDVVLPLALKVLSEDDWQQLDAAFAENRDPLTGHKPEAEYEKLFSFIVNNAPAPIGLGAPL